MWLRRFLEMYKDIFSGKVTIVGCQYSGTVYNNWYNSYNIWYNIYNIWYNGYNIWYKFTWKCIKNSIEVQCVTSTCQGKTEDSRLRRWCIFGRAGPFCRASRFVHRKLNILTLIFHIMCGALLFVNKFYRLILLV